MYINGNGFENKKNKKWMLCSKVLFRRKMMIVKIKGMKDKRRSKARRAGIGAEAEGNREFKTYKYGIHKYLLNSREWTT